MKTLNAKLIGVIALAVGTVAAAPAQAKIYNVVFAGKTIQVDCPESPEGHNMTWVNQNCTALSIGAGGATPARPRSDHRAR